MLILYTTKFAFSARADAVFFFFHVFPCSFWRLRSSSHGDLSAGSPPSLSLPPEGLTPLDWGMNKGAKGFRIKRKGEERRAERLSLLHTQRAENASNRITTPIATDHLLFAFDVRGGGGRRPAASVHCPSDHHRKQSFAGDGGSPERGKRAPTAKQEPLRSKSSLRLLLRLSFSRIDAPNPLGSGDVLTLGLRRQREREREEIFVGSRRDSVVRRRTVEREREREREGREREGRDAITISFPLLSAGLESTGLGLPSTPDTIPRE